MGRKRGRKAKRKKKDGKGKGRVEEGKEGDGMVKPPPSKNSGYGLAATAEERDHPQLAKISKNTRFQR